MKNDFKEVWITEEEIDKKISELGRILSKEYKDKNPILICVLKGAVMFMADIIRKMDIPLEIDFMAVSSYEGIKSSGVVKIVKDLDTKIEARDVVIIEDILDTGRTLDYIIRLLQERNPNSIKVCTLLYKEKKCDKSDNKITPDYVGFTVADEFVVGYGLDYNEKYRNIPFIAVLKEEVYSG